jgi:hypothetical protein
VHSDILLRNNWFKLDHIAWATEETLISIVILVLPLVLANASLCRAVCANFWRVAILEFLAGICLSAKRTSSHPCDPCSSQLDLMTTESNSSSKDISYRGIGVEIVLEILSQHCRGLSRGLYNVAIESPIQFPMEALGEDQLG